jgi:phage shock protein C
MSYGNPILVRHVDDSMIGGVCAGLAHRFGVDVSLVRIAYILFSILSAAFPGTIVYLLLWAVVPDEMGRRARLPWVLVVLLFGLPLLALGCGLVGSLLGALLG